MHKFNRWAEECDPDRDEKSKRRGIDAGETLWSVRLFLGRRREIFSSSACLSNWANTQGDVGKFLGFEFEQICITLIPFWFNFPAARGWVKGGINYVGWIWVTSVTWKSSVATLALHHQTGGRGRVLHYLCRYRVSLTAFYYPASTVVFTSPNWE